MVERRRAAFLDRDGTLIDDPGFLREPDRVTLLPGAADAVARLNAAGLAAVTVSNQSGIARGLYELDDYLAVEDRLLALLSERGARVDGRYYCPHHPDFTGPCGCRKPGVDLFERAAADLGLDLARSWWIGDRVRDLLPSRHFGGRAVLVETGQGATEREEAISLGFPTVPSIFEAVSEHVLRYLPDP